MFYPDKFEYQDEQLKDMFGLNDEELKRLKSIQGRSSHSAWLTFMYPRLYLARKLLKDTGAISVSIDDNEQANLKLLMDEVFGEGNFVADFIIIRSEGGGLAKQAVIGHDYLISYARNINVFIPFGKPKDIRGKIVEIDGENYWIETDWLRREFGKYGTLPYEEIIEVKGEEKKEEIDDGLKSGKYVLIAKGSQHIVGRYRKISEDTSKFYTILKHLNKNGVEDLKKYNLQDIFSYPKPVSLIKELVRGATYNNKNSLILDFFAGSATTADAVMQLNAEDGGNRQYIMVQIPEPTKEDGAAYKAGYKTIDQISRTRIEKAAEKIRTENPLTTTELDLGFKHYTVQEVEINTLEKMKDWESIQNTIFIDDLVSELPSGAETLLTTWLTADGYKFDQKVETKIFDNHKTYHVDNSILYIIEKGWTAKATQELIKAIGKRKLNVNTIIVSEYALGFVDMTELKTNIKTINEPRVQIEVRG